MRDAGLGDAENGGGDEVDLPSARAVAIGARGLLLRQRRRGRWQARGRIIDLRRQLLNVMGIRRIAVGARLAILPKPGSCYYNAR